MTIIDKKPVGDELPGIVIFDEGEPISDRVMDEASYVFQRMRSGNLYIVRHKSGIYLNGRLIT